MKSYFRYLILFFFLVGSVFLQARTVNPLQYGLEEAQNGFERYAVLLRCHQDALKHGYNISYEGIDSIRLDILWDCEPIPLVSDVNFAGATIIVENRAKNCALFDMHPELKSLDVSGGDIDKGEYKRYSELKTGKYLLVIEDAEPWCVRRGSDTELIRKDVILINNGKAENKPIMGYTSASSKPAVLYRKIDGKKIRVRNLNFVRASSSTHKTFCVKICNQYNVELSKISVTTPDNSTLYGDAAIQLENCAKVTLNDIQIDGTYSQSDKFGYGVGLVNIYGLKVNRMYARCNWGVFGTQSLNDIVLKDCDINRFDIHCYGRDVKALKCKFTRLYNQISSVYGKVSFDRCEFKDFTPLLIESSYNAYTPFDLEFKRCVFFLDNTHNFIMTLFGVPQAYNARPELRRKSLPNIIMKDCTVHIPGDVKNWMLVKTGGNYYKDSFDYIANIDIKNVKTVGNNTAVFDLFSEEVKTSEKINVRMR